MSSYLIDVKQVNNIPVRVKADSDQEACEKAKQGLVNQASIPPR